MSTSVSTTIVPIPRRLFRKNLLLRGYEHDSTDGNPNHSSRSESSCRSSCSRTERALPDILDTIELLTCTIRSRMCKEEEVA
eukprot:761964-Hanusia_phi.AAC.3